MYDYEVLRYEIIYNSKYCHKNEYIVRQEEQIESAVNYLKSKGFEIVSIVKISEVIL